MLPRVDFASLQPRGAPPAMTMAGATRLGCRGFALRTGVEGGAVVVVVPCRGGVNIYTRTMARLGFATVAAMVGVRIGGGRKALGAAENVINATSNNKERKINHSGEHKIQCGQPSPTKRGKNHGCQPAKLHYIGSVFKCRGLSYDAIQP
jgi:hypothetical protein